ncbi:MAG: hypothetical protein PHF86_03050 [Candidatus Nanoarchaeia archaeon]|jgi:hypothetical protein|nr:hypothetical protein [Candidatus Nanoarchaeia archaeon]
MRKFLKFGIIFEIIVICIAVFNIICHGVQWYHKFSVMPSILMLFFLVYLVLHYKEGN